MGQKKKNQSRKGSATLSECRQALKAIKESNCESQEALKDILKQLK